VKKDNFTPKIHILFNCGGRREKIWGISCEKSYFFSILGGGRAPGAAPPPPPWIRPWIWLVNTVMSSSVFIKFYCFIYTNMDLYFNIGETHAYQVEK
jgi:hypothetical protein